MNGLLMDTHVWFWYLTGSRRLGRKLRRSVESSQDRLWLSAISIWEMGVLARKGRVSIAGEYRSWAARALESMPVRVVPVDSEIALLSLEIDLPHNDPADRFIAATALVHKLTLATADRRLNGRPWLPAVGG